VLCSVAVHFRLSFQRLKELRANHWRVLGSHMWIDKMLRSLVAVLGVTLASIGVAVLSPASYVRAAVLLEETQFVSATPALAEAAPAEHSLTIVTAGRYTVTLTDLRFPAALTSVDMIITSGIASVARLSKAGSLDFDATPGTYTVRVLGNGTSAGTVNVTITPAGGGTELLNFSEGILPKPGSIALNQTATSTSFTTAVADSYQLSVVDRVFPSALTSYDVLIVDTSGTPIARVCSPAITGVCDETPVVFPANATSYDLFLNAKAATTDNAGLLSIRIDGGPANTSANMEVFAKTLPVGVLRRHADVALPTTGQYSLSLTDLQFPIVLTQARAVLVQGSNLVADVAPPSDASTPDASFSADSGAATLYLFATPQSSAGAGTYEIKLTQGQNAILDDVDSVTLPSINTLHAYVITAPIATSGRYLFQIQDFDFPSSLASLRAVVIQKGTSLGMLSTNAPLETQLAAAPVNVVVLANTSASTSLLGLINISIDEAPPSTVHVFDFTQPVGDLINTRTVLISTAGDVDMSMRDLQFPAAFGDLALAVTRGSTMVGQVFGGSKFTFAATPGEYVLSFLARDSTAVGYGLYGTKLEDAPLKPSVTFNASVTTIGSGGTTNVTWTSVGTTACLASGGWNGTQPVSGSVDRVGPFSTDTTLTLTCTGPGGSASSSIKVVVAAQSNKEGSSSGAGALNLSWMLILALLCGIRVRNARGKPTYY
jgi:hypothetical protein